MKIIPPCKISWDALNTWPKWVPWSPIQSHQGWSLYRANGGYLILDARKVLLQPFAWEELKRALRSREIRIEVLGQTLSLFSTVSLEPEPIPWM